MAEGDKDIDDDDKTEEASVERREDFRERGSVAHSHELSQVAGLAAIALFISWYTPQVVSRSEEILVKNFQAIQWFRVSEKNVLKYLGSQWIDILYIILPFFAVAAVASGITSLLQTQFNWSWKKLEPDWSKLNPINGIGKLFSKEMLVGLLRTTAKLSAVSVIAWLVLAGEWQKVPALMNANYTLAWIYWTEITTQLLWGVVALMLFVGAGDFIYSYISLENKMKMTKQEVKDEIKQRESDPHVKAKLRRMAREIANRKTVENTKKATVLITNPTHYSVAVRYEFGMPAPVVVAKGADFLALKMRETAKDLDIPIVENKPLARALYASVKEGEEVPVGMYQAISEIIKFVFKLKGISITKARENKTNTSETRR
jgi:flagellar biosynthesis protein FlhB